MKTVKQILIIGILILLFANNSCTNKKNNYSLNPRLPFSKNFSDRPSSDSSMFTIEIKENKILIKDYKSYALIKGFDEIEPFVCKELKSNHINPYSGRLVFLMIDSVTPFPIVDRLIEELGRIGFNVLFFRTSNKGFFIVFHWKEYFIKENLVKLYGPRFSSSEYITYVCKDTTIIISKSKDSSVVDQTPPPPPPPPPPRLMLQTMTEADYKKLKEYDRMDSLKQGVIELTEGVFKINGRKYLLKDFKKEINNNETLFIKLNAKNNYSDFIKIIDLINTVNLERYNQKSLLKFNKQYKDLDEDSSRQIRKDFGIRYWILSLAEQVYIDEN
jgi:hypothetical protein